MAVLWIKSPPVSYTYRFFFDPSAIPTAKSTTRQLYLPQKSPPVSYTYRQKTTCQLYLPPPVSYTYRQKARPVSYTYRQGQRLEVSDMPGLTIFMTFLGAMVRGQAEVFWPRAPFWPSQS